MKRGIARLVLVCWLFTNIGFIGLVSAQSVPMVGLSVSADEVSKGDTVTYNFNYSNLTAGDITDTVLTLDRPIDGGLSFISSSFPVEWTPDSRPIFRVGTVAKNFSGGIISLTVRVNSNFTADSLTAIAAMKGMTNQGEVSINSAATSVAVVEKVEEEKKEEEKKTEEEKKESDQTTVVEKDKEVKKLGIMAEGVDKIEVNKIVGLADLSKFKQTTQWDKRVLYIGVIAFILLIIVGVGAYFIGKKSKQV